VRSLLYYPLGHELTICDPGQMRAAISSAASSCKQNKTQGAADVAIPADLRNPTPGRSDSHRNQYSSLGALGAFSFQGDAAPTKPSPAPDEHRPSPLFADGDDTSRSTANQQSMERAITNGPETRTKGGETALPAPVVADCTANISRGGVNDDLSLQSDKNAPLVEEHGDENHLNKHTNSTEVNATQSPLAQRGVGQVGSEVARLAFRLPVNASMGWYRSHSYDEDIESDAGDSQGESPVPMEEDELEPTFGALSNTITTTFDPLPGWHPHLYGHSLNVQRDDHVGEDNSLVDLAMEDVGTEAGNAVASGTAATPLQSFSWIPPSASSAFHAPFAGVPSQQTATFVNDPTHVIESPMPGNSFAMDMTTFEGARLQHAIPPQDIAWPNGTYPLPSVEVESLKAPEHFIPRLSPTPISSIFAGQAANHSSFPPTPSPTSNAGPVPVSPSTCRPIGEHEDGVKALNREMDSELAVVVSVQHKASSLRYVKSRRI
jgi:hypothetical protein